MIPPTIKVINSAINVVLNVLIGLYGTEVVAYFQEPFDMEMIPIIVPSSALIVLVVFVVILGHSRCS